MIECFDWDKNSDPDLIGTLTVTAGALRKAAGSSDGFAFVNE